MDINQFKPRGDEKYIIIENGKPVGVLISIEDYQRFFLNKDKNLENKTEKNFFNPQNFTETFNVNKTINQRELTRELTIEDLPF